MSGDGKENAQCSTAHNLHCSRIGITLSYRGPAQSSPGLVFVCPRFSGALAILVEIKQ